MLEVCYPKAVFDWLYDKNSKRLDKAESHWVAFAIDSLFW
jgi:hypothetical protein